MKAILTAVFMVAFSFLTANLEINKPFEHVQPDGTSLSLYVSGDEYYHRVHDENDYTILKHPQTCYAVYAVQEGESIKASEYIVGSADPSALGIPPRLFKRDPAIERYRQEQTARDGRHDSPTIGTLRNIVCFIRFDGETSFADTISYDDYYAHFNSNAQPSLKDYYQEVSNGQLTINSSLFPEEGPNGMVLSIEVDHERGFYQPYDYFTNPSGYMTIPIASARLNNLVSEVVDALNDMIPGTLDIDEDNDGVMDAMVFVIRGEPDNWGDLLWPQHIPYPEGNGEINSVEVKHCIFTFEAGFGPSVVCHEIGHNIGFPDLYHYTSSAPWHDIKPVRKWDLMATNTNPPQHSLAYTKWKYGGWFTTLNTFTPGPTPIVVDLAAISTNPYACIKILSTDPNQYYILEYRRKTGRYESGIPASGLIVTRVNTAVSGNADGPPDEVYVYRPGGIVDTNGSPDDANFSAESGRTSIHNYTDPKPWLWVNESTTPDGNLVITNVGSAGGSVIQFAIRSTIPYVWNGSVSTSWTNPSNWIQGSVPSSIDYVEIPPGCPRWPYLVTNESCHHLTVRYGAYLTIYNGSLQISNDFENNGTIMMNNADGLLSVGRDLKFNAGSAASITALATIKVNRYADFMPSSNVNMANGFLEFYGSGSGLIRTYSATTIHHLRINKPSPSGAGVGSASTAVLTIGGNIYVIGTVGSTFNHHFSGETRLLGSLYAYPGSQVHCYYGTISLEGGETETISIADAGNYLHHLKINKTGGASVGLSYPIDVNGNLTIQSGYFQAGTHTVNIGGNWSNNVGTYAFYEGTGTVIIDGYQDQYFGTENFNNLILNKSGGEWIISTGADIFCNSYDWTAGAYRVNGGTFSVQDLADSGIYGTITLTYGQIDYQQDASHYADIAGMVNISGGTFNIHGTAGANYLAYDLGELHMSGGVLDYKHQGVAVSATHLFNGTITGGTIKTVKGFEVYRSDFNPTGGTIELYGNTNCNLRNTEGSNFYSVTINKTSSRSVNVFGEIPWTPDREGFSTPPMRDLHVTGVGPLDINGTFRLQNGYFHAPELMKVAGNWTNTAGAIYFYEGTGTVEFDGSVNQYCNYTEVFNEIILNKSGGALRLNAVAASLACNIYTWQAGAVRVDIGTFTAYDLSQDGIYGEFETYSSGTVNLHQDIYQYIDVNGILRTNGGQINIFGGSDNSYFGYDGAGAIDLNGGVIDFKDWGITIDNEDEYFSFNVFDGVLRTTGSFNDLRGGVNFSGGELEFYGSADKYIRSGTGSTFYIVRINKSGSRGEESLFHAEVVRSRYREESSGLRLDSIYAYSNLQINNYLQIDSGTFFLNGKTVIVGNGVNVYGILRLNAASSLRMSGGTNLNVYDGGLLETLGNSITRAVITRHINGYVRVNIESGGNISAAYTTFEFMNTDGLYIKNGALVSETNSLNYCKFQMGISGGTLLTVDNSQDLTVTGAIFVPYTGGYNVSKTVNQGTVTFVDYSGDLSGEDYENDPFSRIFWGTDLQPVSAPVITYDPLDELVWLHWVYPLPFDRFNIYSSSSPDGPFTLAGTTTLTNWSDAEILNKRFYRVTVVRD